MSVTRSYKAQKLVERLQVKVNRQIMLSLEACVHCGLCTDQCHYVLSNPGDVTYAPAYKADRIRKLFKAHIDWTGKTLPWWVGAKSVYTDQELEDLKDTVFGKCTNCRRCSLNCPMGVDMAVFNRMARGLLVHVGVMPEGVAVVAKDQWEIGNQMGVLKEDYLETLAWMEEELQSEYNDHSIRIPIDKMDADVVYSINPREAKYDPRTIAEAAAIFHFAGESWTMPSEGWDMTNFGLFNGDDELGGAVGGRLYDAVERLRGKKLVISECGHGFRSTRCEAPNWGKRDVAFPDGKRRHHHAWLHQARPHPGGQEQELRAGHLPRFLQQRTQLRHDRGASRTAEPGVFRLSRDAPQPRRELLLHRRRRRDVDDRVRSAASQVRPDQGRSTARPPALRSSSLPATTAWMACST